MPSQKRPIAIDLFAGAGGMTLGFEQAGFDVLASVEIDPIHCATHEFNFPFWKIFCRSVIDITGEEIRSQSQIGDRDIDVIFGGPPCQGFSLMGKRALDDPRNSLVKHFVRLVTDLQPKYFVMENVRGLTVGKHKQFLLEVIEAFQVCGYEVETNYQVLNAAHYGVPQDRQRLFLLGCRQGLPLPSYPLPQTKPVNFKPTKQNIILQNLPVGPTVADAIADLPEVEEYPELLKQDWLEYEFADFSSDYSRILRSLQELPNDYAYPRLFEPNLLTGNLRTIHTELSQKRFQSTLPGKVEPISRFLKLDPSGISNTLRAGTPSNRGAFTSPRPIHPYTPRCITVREAARLHSYPDWFRFHATKWHGFRQIGNSVPPLLAKAVAQEIAQVLDVQVARPKVKKHLGKPFFLKLNMSKAAAEYEVSSQVIEPRMKKVLQRQLTG